MGHAAGNISSINGEVLGISHKGKSVHKCFGYYIFKGITVFSFAVVTLRYL